MAWTGFRPVMTGAAGAGSARPDCGLADARTGPDPLAGNCTALFNRLADQSCWTFQSWPRAMRGCETVLHLGTGNEGRPSHLRKCPGLRRHRKSRQLPRSGRRGSCCVRPMVARDNHQVCQSAVKVALVQDDNRAALPLSKACRSPRTESFSDSNPGYPFTERMSDAVGCNRKSVQTGQDLPDCGRNRYEGCTFRVQLNKR